jgi:hypothetical protein
MRRMNMKAYFLPEKALNPKANALKAMTDINCIFNEEKLEEIIPPCHVNPENDIADPLYRRKVLRDFKKKGIKMRNEIIFVQYPTYLGNAFLFPHYVRKVAKRNRIVYIIHDLNGLRYKVPYFEMIDRHLLNKAYRIVSHNQSMTDYLIEKYHIDPKKIINLGMFDYLTDKPYEGTRKKEDGIAFAGNLRKAETMLNEYKRLSIKAQLNVYGSKSPLSEFEGENIRYYGVFPPDIIQQKMVGGFGLVWDGTSVDDCKGLFGEYIKYNNPHKASLYVVSHLPLIVSNESAVAKFVLAHHIGFGVDSLRQIPDIISKMSQEEYQEMLTNLSSLAEKVSKGGMMKEVIEKIILDN